MPVRSRVLAVVGATLVTATLALGACSASSTPSPTEGAPATGSPAAGASDSPGFPRTVASGHGDPVTLDRAPTRVAVLVSGAPDQMLSLGETPIAIATTGGSADVPAYLTEPLAGVERVGTSSEVQLEKLATLEPDLIITSKVASADDVDLLTAIAPTVFTAAEVGRGWKTNLTQLGELLGQETEAAQVLGDYERRAAALGAAVSATTGSTPSVSLVRFGPDQIRLIQPASFPGTILADAGFTRPASQQDTTRVSVDISAEKLEQADADFVFNASTTLLSDGGSAYRSSPLWKQLSAVEAGNVAEVGDDIWFVGLGPAAADQVLADIAEAFGVPTPT